MRLENMATPLKVVSSTSNLSSGRCFKEMLLFAYDSCPQALTVKYLRWLGIVFERLSEISSVVDLVNGAAKISEVVDYLFASCLLSSIDGASGRGGSYETRYSVIRHVLALPEYWTD